MALRRLSQSDWAAGMVRSMARHLIPQSGAYDVLNGLLTEDGSIYRRGGSSYRSNKVFGTAGVLKNLATNPSAEVDLAGWTSSGGTFSRVTDWSPVGSAAFRVADNGSSQLPLARLGLGAAVAGDVISVGCRVNVAVAPSNGTYIEINWLDSGGVVLRTDDEVFSGAGEGEVSLVTPAAPAGTASARFTIYLFQGFAGQGADVRFDAVIAAKAATLPAYFDGSTPHGVWDGTAHASTSTQLVTSGLRWAWDGFLAGGRRTVFASADDFGVLAADDASVVNLGGAGLAAPTRAVMVGGMLFIGGGAVYGGSLKAADYSTGTVAVTNGSKVVTGTSTLWSANVDRGMLLRVAGAGRYYPVGSVDSNTQVTLADAYEGATASGQAYALTRLGTAGSPYRTADFYATVAERLVTGEGSQVFFSNSRSEAGVLRPHVFDATDYHELPGGVQILGLAELRGQLLIFSTDGVWSVGNMAYDLTDAQGNVQQQVQSAGREIILWGQAGIAEHENALVIPATDGVYLVDGISAPVRLSESITPLISEYVRLGYRPGGAVVFNSHYFLPVLDASAVVQDLLVCRLDRALRGRSLTIFPWTRFDGHGGRVTALTRRVGGASSARQPDVLAAGSDGLVVSLGGVFDPGGARASDADGTAHTWRVETRDWATGERQNLNHVRRVRIRYELTDAASDDPVISGSYSMGEEVGAPPKWGAVTWGAFNWGSAADAEFTPMANTAPEDEGRDPFTWHLQARARFFRVRLQSTDPAATLVLRSVETYLRESPKDS